MRARPSTCIRKSASLAAGQGHAAEASEGRGPPPPPFAPKMLTSCRRHPHGANHCCKLAHTMAGRLVGLALRPGRESACSRRRRGCVCGKGTMFERLCADLSSSLARSIARCVSAL